MTPVSQAADQLVPVNPYWIGGSFLEYCVRQGWMVKQRESRSLRYFCTSAGVEALVQFGIEVKRPELGKATRPAGRVVSRQASRRR
jgi:hypothetical protein